MAGNGTKALRILTVLLRLQGLASASSLDFFPVHTFVEGFYNYTWFSHMFRYSVSFVFKNNLSIGMCTGKNLNFAHWALSSRRYSIWVVSISVYGFSEYWTNQFHCKKPLQLYPWYRKWSWIPKINTIVYLFIFIRLHLIVFRVFLSS